MSESEKLQELEELQEIPGVGKKIARDLWSIGIRSIGDLEGRDPEELYGRLCLQEGVDVDRCILYVFRCAVYYASNETHDPELLKWWRWKDGPEASSGFKPVVESHPSSC
ncbi:MAG: helix-hairpin-helix domain-containing protein [Actinomycetia bacterium]|nr:helix-hairpin-helix domain-containing protein [Actinomycetes bacterium]